MDICFPKLSVILSKVKIKLYELFDIDWRVLAYVILFFSNIVNL